MKVKCSRFSVSPEDLIPAHTDTPVHRGGQLLVKVDIPVGGRLVHALAPHSALVRLPV